LKENPESRLIVVSKEFKKDCLSSGNCISVREDVIAEGSLSLLINDGTTAFLPRVDFVFFL
jgi:hypothetical protein